MVTDLHLSAERQRAMDSGERRAVHVLAIGGGSAAVSIRPTINTRHFGIPAIRVEKCQEKNKDEQRISLRFAERYDHSNLTSRDAEIRFRSINVEVSPDRWWASVLLRDHLAFDDDWPNGSVAITKKCLVSPNLRP